MTQRPAPDVRGSANGPSERIPVERADDHGSLLDVTVHLDNAGFDGQFRAELDGMIRCLTCGEAASAGAQRANDVVRMEGASDPADSTIVVPVVCPHCGTAGTLIAHYGPEASAEEAEVLVALNRDEPSEGSAAVPTTPKNDLLTESPSNLDSTTTAQRIPINMHETTEAMVIVAPMPAVMPDDVNVRRDGSTIILEASLRSAADRDREYQVHEWDYGHYHRAIDLPDGFEGPVSASLGNGQLAVRVLRTGSELPPTAGHPG